jgi:glycosyltransferase involved in cell wall biosynthesis
VSRLGLSRKISFLGWVKNISPYLKKSDIFVLSSKREGFGYVLIEAMSQGKPVISTNTPYGPSEILDNGKYGILVPMGDEEAMKRAILKLLTDKKKYHYYAKKAFERSEFFSLDKMLRAYKKLIVGLIK